MRTNALAVLVLFVSTLAGAQQPATWRLLEEWRVGGEPDGALSFNDVRALRVLPNGQLAVLEFKDQQVHILDASGHAVRTVGRKGSGPGEFRAANGLVVSPSGEIIVNDPPNARLTIFSTAGDLVRTVPSQFWGYGYVWDGRFEPDGRLNEMVLFRRAGDTAVTQGRRIWSTDFSKTDTVVSPRCPGTAEKPSDVMFSYRAARSSGNMGIPFVAPGTASVVGDDGYMWSGIWPDFGTIERRPPGQCDVASTIRLRGPRIPISKADRDAAEKSVRDYFTKAGADIPDLSKIPTELPAFDVLYLDASNRLWVERPVASGPRRVEIYSATGVLLAQSSEPLSIVRGRPVVITNDHIYAFTKDADDLQYLVALKIVRN